MENSEKKDLTKIQAELKVAKTRKNSYGDYFYRSVDDIMEALKPLLLKYNCTLKIDDDVLLVGDRTYIKSTATFTDSKGEMVTSTSVAREQLDQKGMVAAMVTGSVSSYARKYVLGALFLIDDSADIDTLEVIDGSELSEATKKDIAKCKTVEEVTKAYNKHLPKYTDTKKLIEACKIRKAELTN